MGSAKIVTDGQLEAALRKHAGIKSYAAKELRISRQAVQDRVDRSPRMQAVLVEINEVMLDRCEGLFDKALKKNDIQTAKWLAERKGKHRGYANKVEASLDDAQLEGFVASLGGDPDKLRAALAAFGVSPAEGS